MKFKLTIIILALDWLILMWNSIIMSIEFQQSFASNETELDVAWRMGIAMPIIGAILLSVCVSLNYFKSHYLMVVSAILFLGVSIYEFHGYAGYFSNVNAEFESNSRIATLQAEQVKTSSEQVSSLSEFHNVNIASLTNQLEILKQINISANRRLNACPPRFNKNCKMAERQKVNESRAKINEIKNKIEGANRYQAALASKKEAVKMAIGGDETSESMKAHPAFKTISRVLHGDITKAKYYQAKFLLFLSFLLLFLAQCLPAIITRLMMGHVSTSKDKTNFLNAESIKNIFTPPPKSSNGYQDSNIGFTASINPAQKVSDAAEPQFKRGVSVSDTAETVKLSEPEQKVVVVKETVKLQPAKGYKICAYRECSKQFSSDRKTKYCCVQHKNRENYLKRKKQK